MVGRMLAALVMVGTLSPAPALAQDSPPIESPPPVSTDATASGPEREGGSGTRQQVAWLGDWNLILGVGGQHAFRGDLDDQGDVAITRVGADISFAGDIGDKFRISASLDGEVSFYDFDGATRLIPGTSDPWDELYDTGISVTGIYSIDDKWSIFGGGFARLGFEEGADIGRSITGGGTVGVGIEITPDLRIRLGVGVTSQLEDQVRVFPAVGIDWTISKVFTLQSDGLGLRLNAQLNEQLLVYLSGKFEYRQYRLDEDRDLLDSGVVRDSRVPIALGVVWDPVKNFSISFEGGVMAYQEYEVLRNDGIKLNDQNTDPAFFIGGRIEFKF